MLKHNDESTTLTTMVLNQKKSAIFDQKYIYFVNLLYELKSWMKWIKKNFFQLKKNLSTDHNFFKWDGKFVWLLTNSQTASNNGIAAGHKKIVVGKTFETRHRFRGKWLLWFSFSFFQSIYFQYTTRKK